MKASEMLESKYLKKEDVDPPKLLTIAGFEKANVAKQNETPEFKWLMKFHETKPLVMNAANIQLATHALGNDDTDLWIGKKIVAFNDPTVMYAGKMVGGIRLRAPRGQATQAPAPAPEFDDNLPDSF